MASWDKAKFTRDYYAGYRQDIAEVEEVWRKCREQKAAEEAAVATATPITTRANMESWDQEKFTRDYYAGQS